MLRRAALIITASLMLAAPCTGQNQGGAQGSKTQPGDAPPQSGSTQPKAQNASGTFSEAVVNALLKRMNDGFAAHSAPVVLSAFDRARMRDYPRFADRLQSTFTQYESFRLHFHVAELSGQGDTGTAVVEVEYEGSPLSEVSPPVRKGGQLRFEFARTPQGWKIISMQPWNFFS